MKTKPIFFLLILLLTILIFSNNVFAEIPTIEQIHAGIRSDQMFMDSWQTLYGFTPPLIASTDATYVMLLQRMQTRYRDLPVYGTGNFISEYVDICYLGELHQMAALYQSFKVDTRMSEVVWGYAPEDQDLINNENYWNKFYTATTGSWPWASEYVDLAVLYLLLEDSNKVDIWKDIFGYDLRAQEGRLWLWSWDSGYFYDTAKWSPEIANFVHHFDGTPQTMYLGDKKYVTHYQVTGDSPHI